MPDVAAAIVDRVRNPTLVALGGGRVIDTAKAIAAVRGGRVCAIPTTLSGAEMTRIHRLPGRPRGSTRRHLVRPSLVIADPFEMTTLDDRSLRASAMNALGHGAEALYVPLANPVATLAALRGAELIAAALDQEPGERDRGGLALGARCSARTRSTRPGSRCITSSARRSSGWSALPHAETNAAMLPRTMDAMRARAPEEIASLAHALGVGARRDPLADRVARRRSRGGFGDLGGNPDRIESARDAMLAAGGARQHAGSARPARSFAG